MVQSDKVTDARLALELLLKLHSVQGLAKVRCKIICRLRLNLLKSERRRILESLRSALGPQPSVPSLSYPIARLPGGAVGVVLGLVLVTDLIYFNLRDFHITDAL